MMFLIFERRQYSDGSSAWRLIDDTAKYQGAAKIRCAMWNEGKLYISEITTHICAWPVNGRLS